MADESLNISQQTRLQQRLNPRQVIFGRFLEMTPPEVEEAVRRAVDENPALEEKSASDNLESIDDFNETAEELQRADYGSDDDIPFYRLEANNRSADDNDYEPVLTDGAPSLYEALREQLAELNLDTRDTTVAEYIIGSLDDNGYLTRGLPEIVEDLEIREGMDVTLADVKRVFARVRSLDPAGVGAVDLRDCLLLQIDRAPRSFEARVAREIVADWFDLFSKKHFDKIRSHLGIDRDVLAGAIEFITTLNPKPGSLLETVTPTDRLRHIVPDFSVDVDSDGHVTVALLSRTPELAVESSFDLPDSDTPSANRRQREADIFIRRRRDEALAFIKMLEMRSQTLMAVMESIVRLQPRFFATDDPSAIKPMIIKDIAELTGLDISVISRATTGKYVLTRHGVYPLKMFFNERPKEDADMSSHEIVEALRKIIDSEDKHRPLSDEALRQRLADAGYDIARRTVTKYRERLGQPVARLRKQF